MMDPLNSTFDFLDVKVKPVDGHVEEPVPTTKVEETSDVVGKKKRACFSCISFTSNNP